MADQENIPTPKTKYTMTTHKLCLIMIVILVIAIVEFVVGPNGPCKKTFDADGRRHIVCNKAD